MCGPNQIESLSRSAASPALPMAITTRPQLGSSPKIADFRSGELAQASAIVRAAAQLSAPPISKVTNLRQTLAVLGDLDGEIAHEILQGGAEGLRGADPPASVDGLLAALRRRAGGEQQAGVAGRCIAVDGHAVERRLHMLPKQALQCRRRWRRP